MNLVLLGEPASLTQGVQNNLCSWVGFSASSFGV